MPIRRFLIHVLPGRFHRIRHYGFLAGSGRKEKVARVRAVLGTAGSGEPDQPEDGLKEPLTLREPCPDCGGPMRIIETFRRGEVPRSRAPPRLQAA
ncbi:Putative transposase [Phaeobacter inhibens]|nr:Putative transposase [Phaeobacter inhibens]